jgi:hypothetical protein
MEMEMDLPSSVLGKRKNVENNTEVVLDIYENINLPTTEFLEKDEDNAIIFIMKPINQSIKLQIEAAINSFYENNK